tara:strand:- start:627 stop:1679 length:1053 start_codon:yes stop_codon:yes gene_type:complete
MTIEYKDSKRIEASGIGTELVGIGGWKEVGRTTLGSANGTINVGSLADKRYYMILHDMQGTSSASGGTEWQFNSDTGNNYAKRDSQNGGTDSTAINQPKILAFGTQQQPMFTVGYLSNLSTKEKLWQWWVNHAGDSAGASVVPYRQEGVGKWANTSNAFDEIDYITTGSETFDTNSEVVVLGWDEDDTHTTNFWEELATVELNGNADEMDTGTITAKKYLWVQAYVNTTGAQDNQSFRFNGDTGNNYCWRDSRDGASDATVVNYNYLRTCVGDDNNNFVNAFIINNSANEKLIISHAVKQTTAGAGNEPKRNETVGKWVNTSAQITSINLKQHGNGDMTSGSILKVWGSD